MADTSSGVWGRHVTWVGAGPAGIFWGISQVVDGHTTFFSARLCPTGTWSRGALAHSPGQGRSARKDLPGEFLPPLGRSAAALGKRAAKTHASQAACNCRNLFQWTLSSCRESVNLKHDTGQPGGYGDSVWLSGAEPWCVVCTSAFRAGRSPSRPAPQGHAHLLVQSQESVFTVAWGVGCRGRQPFPQPRHLGACPWAWVLALISPPLQCLPWGLTPSREPRRHD